MLYVLMRNHNGKPEVYRLDRGHALLFTSLEEAEKQVARLLRIVGNDLSAAFAKIQSC